MDRGRNENDGNKGNIQKLRMAIGEDDVGPSDNSCRTKIRRL